MWAAINFTYYTGGQTSVNDYYKDDRQNNSRLGASFNFPLSKVSAIKIAYSTGAIIRLVVTSQLYQSHGRWCFSRKICLMTEFNSILKYSGTNLVYTLLMLTVLFFQ